MFISRQSGRVVKPKAEGALGSTDSVTDRHIGGLVESILSWTMVLLAVLLIIGLWLLPTFIERHGGPSIDTQASFFLLVLAAGGIVEFFGLLKDPAPSPPDRADELRRSPQGVGIVRLPDDTTDPVTVPLLPVAEYEGEVLRKTGALPAAQVEQLIQVEDQIHHRVHDTIETGQTTATPTAMSAASDDEQQRRHAAELADEEHQKKLSAIRLERALNESRIEALKDPDAARRRYIERMARGESPRAEQRARRYDTLASRATCELNEIKERYGEDSETYQHAKKAWDAALEQFVKGEDAWRDGKTH